MGEDTKKTEENSEKKDKSTVVGVTCGAIGGAAGVAAVPSIVAAGSTGAGMVATTSGLAAAGSLGGLTTGTMAGGILVCAATPLVCAAALGVIGYGLYKLFK